MKIVILHPHLLYPSGASKYMLEVASRLIKKGLSVTVILTKYDRSLTSKYKDINFVEIGDYSTGDFRFWLTFPLFFLKLKKSLDLQGEKLLFPQIFPPVWWAAIYKFFSPRTPIVWMCQEPSAFIHSPLVIKSLPQPMKSIVRVLNPILKVIDYCLLNQIDYIIANSNYGSSLIKQTYDRKADLIAYPAVDPKVFQPAKEKEKYIFTVSRLDKQKNIDLIIKAYSLLPQQILDEYKLVIGGVGAEEENLKKMAIDLSLRKQVIFLGRIEDEALPGYYAKATLVIFLGESEPFGIVPVEAMSCGTPVIALKAGGVVESVIDKKTGILISKKDEHLLAGNVEELLMDKKLCREMSENARNCVVKKFSWDNTANEIDRFLKYLYED